MDSPTEHTFTFNEALSLQVNCDDQAEVDKLWNALSAVPEAEQCGWLKDRFGVSWQIVPTAFPKLMQNSDPQKAKRVTEALLKMKKLDIAALQQASE
jgi:predicted 3-demethylubiquinone-9 3-methyltransferase (glyoxalase superfamily)